MRHVISAREVCEAWVDMDEQEYAHTQTRNISFINWLQLVSYSTNIASRLVIPVTGQHVIFVTRYNYSVTTNKQLRELDDALSTTKRLVIYVPHTVPTMSHELPGIWKEMLDEVQVLWQKAARARTRMSYYLAEGNTILKDANKIVDLFNLKITDGIIIDKLEDMNELMRVHEAQIKLRA